MLEQLWQLYWHDLSEFRGSMPGPDGRFNADKMLPYLGDDPDRAAFVLLLDGSPAGFALILGLGSETRMIGEFFVVRAARRQGVGYAAALELLRTHPGRWQLAFQEENPRAARLWRRVAQAAAGDAWYEERRPVPNKPHIPPDVWMHLDTAGATSGGRSPTG
jgi:predicted acetyltransferase